jgi:hypothetical protein
MYGHSVLYESLRIAMDTYEMLKYSSGEETLTHTKTF